MLLRNSFHCWITHIANVLYNCAVYTLTRYVLSVQLFHCCSVVLSGFCSHFVLSFIISLFLIAPHSLSPMQNRIDHHPHIHSHIVIRHPVLDSPLVQHDAQVEQHKDEHEQRHHKRNSVIAHLLVGLTRDDC